MKKLTFLLTFLLLIVFSTEAQWKQSYLWTSSEIRTMSVLNDNTVWVKEFYGNKIAFTNDGGLNWTTKDLPITFNYQEGGICAVNTTTAYNIVCQGSDLGLYKTVDGATTWTKQNAFNSTSTFPDFVYFWNENEGVTVGDGNSNLKFEIYTTSDGGNTWNPVPASSMPNGPTDYTYNSNNIFRVHANTIYYLTNFGKIMKSTNKGISWTEINTPLTSMVGASFDFKDDFNGILTYNYLGQSKVYTTSDAGNTWSQVSSAPLFIGDVRYSAANNAYLSANYNYGYSYSTDNGLTWTQNLTFNKVGLGMIDVTSTGKVFVGGLGTVFYTDNYMSENIAVKSTTLTGYNTIDVSYTKEPYLLSSTDTTNYQISSIRLGKISKMLIKTITQDATDKTLLHLVLENNLPDDSIKLTIKNIYDLNGASKGNPLLYNGSGNIIYFRNYSTSKTINVTTPGGLRSLFSAVEKSRISQLTVTGTIDAGDFKIMRDSLIKLDTLDISGTTIAAYTGTEGTYATTTTTYNANEIPRQALYRKSTLTSILLPSSITSIARSAFNSCTSITSITIPSGVVNVGQYAFNTCSSLASVSIPNSVTVLGYGVFFNCTKLSQLSLPAYLSAISDECFSYSGLTTISIPSTVNSISNSAFWNCNNLTDIHVDGANTSYSSSNGVLFDKNAYKIIQYPSAKSANSYDIPSSVTLIGDNCFNGCINLTAINIPVFVNSIGSGAFLNSSIASIYLPRLVSTISDDAFFDCSKLKAINVDPLNVNFISIDGVLFNSNATTLITYPNGLSGSYNIPNTVTSIGDYAFKNSIKLSSVVIPPSTKSIGNYSFYYCTSLTNVTIPNTVTSLSSGAFFNCTSLSTIRVYDITPLNLLASSEVFHGVPTYTCTLYVPKGSKAAYQEADQWSAFSNIVEFDLTGVPILLDENIHLSILNNTLHINGISTQASLRLFDINGKMLLNSRVSNNEIVSFNSLPKGLYILKLIAAEGTVERKIIKN
jgi:photosystem II stability/assembly factor-like uncharacterized protein